MERSQSFSIDTTPAPVVYVCTTGISKIERGLLELPANIVLQDVLTPQTQYLVAYRFRGAAKHAQALRWGIPVVGIGFLYDPGSDYRKYELRPFEGALFSTSGVADGRYANYFALLGAVYQPNVSVFIDFLVSGGCDGEEDKENGAEEKLNRAKACDGANSKQQPVAEKVLFCTKYGIPTVRTADAFGTDYDLFVRRSRADAKQLRPRGMFFDRVFFLDRKLPGPIFNKLRRLIIEHEGTRVSTLSSGIDYVLAWDAEEHQEYTDRLFHYQYVFDCVEADALLFPEFYRVHSAAVLPVLSDVVCAVDASLGTQIINKLSSLGAAVRTSVDARTTHVITTRPTAAPHPVAVRPEWVDQCLSVLRHVKEARFACGGPRLSLARRRSAQPQPSIPLFQFSALSTALRAAAIQKLSDLGLAVSESSSYEHCTHLIMGELNCSEKFFSALANGRWILTPAFIPAFDNSPGFDYSRFEWTPENTMAPREQRHAASIKKWRTRIQSGGKQPFHKWVVKIYSPDAKRLSYERLIGHGGGAVTQNDDYTHVFVDKNYKDEVKEPNSLNADYIFSYLLK